MPPRVIFLLIPTLIFVIFSAFRSAGDAMSKLDIRILVLFHAFRLPLELVLHGWFENGTVPEQMTFSGYNFDIVIGSLALVLTPIADKVPRVVVKLFHTLGLVMLTIIGVIAILSAPTPFKQFDGIPLNVAYHFPYVLIVTICVAGAIFGHISALRKTP